ncbi:hypothetical protein AWB78_00202 [Caballeronia calidae]|uniref:Uncharacterized protein n=1 Tax=Caballeronia calidae TaxID=1777139 RepID=A0A157Z781_9BURK|nr:hypothetical protein AWB78_00202 [Caballeronia calidae]
MTKTESIPKKNGPAQAGPFFLAYTVKINDASAFRSFVHQRELRRVLCKTQQSVIFHRRKRSWRQIFFDFFVPTGNFCTIAPVLG